MTEKARKIFDILGVEPAEEFRIVKDGMICRFSEDLTLQCRISDRYFEAVENVDTYRKIISGETKIIKIPKPTEEDKIVTAYAKLLGFPYVAMDEDGVVRAFKEKPIKYKSGVWEVEKEFPCENYNYINLHYKISFLSWKDKEPYYVGE